MTIPFFQRIDKLDDIIESGPDTVEVESAVLPLFEEGTSRAYFLNHLSSPAWLGPLRHAGFFESSPEPASMPGGSYWPSWPESKYLVRMAASAPEEVRDIIVSIHETPNPEVNQSFAEAALNMPAGIAVGLMPRLISWLQGTGHMLDVDTLGKLVAQLAEGGELASAMELARYILAILPDPEADKKREGDGVLTPSLEPRSRIDSWGYGRFLQEYMPVLVKKASTPALEMLADLLTDAVSMSLNSAEAQESHDDFSFIWRPAVEEHEQNRHDSMKSLLVSAVRDSAELLLRDMAVEIESLVASLEARRFNVFRRIALHLLRVFPDRASKLISSRLTDHEFFSDPGVRHEYALLVNEQFKNLSATAKHEILSWIEKGPDEPSEGVDAKRYADAWRRAQLSFISDSLPASWKRRYEGLVADLGPAEHPEFPFYFTGFSFGSATPTSEADLTSMAIPDIVHRLKTWEPAKEMLGPTPEGLGRALTAAILAQPRRFARAALQFRQVSEPTYVNAFFRGLEDALKQKRLFSWGRVIVLARWVMDQPRSIPGRSDNGQHDRDPDWGWTRKSIANLLEEGFAPGRGSIPFRLRYAAWDVVEALTGDPDPTPEHEKQYGGSNMDRATMAINSVRGTALTAAIRYAFWIRRRLERRADSQELAVRSFHDMPEVRDVLERHLDTVHDSSLAIRAVYGQWFPQLVLLDRNWATANVDQVFPSSEYQRPLWEAAWNTYMVFSQLYGSVYDVLQEKYCLAVERLGRSTEASQESDTVNERLSQHLMVLFWWGRLDVPDLEPFFALAGPRLRGEALRYTGRSLAESTRRIPPENRMRFQRLWEWRMEVSADQNPAHRRAELNGFGWWFISGKFRKDWATEQLHSVLRLANWVEPAHDVIKQLADIASKSPRFAIDCLSMMAEGDSQGWAVGHSWNKELRAIVKAAMVSTDVKARQAATDFVNRLGARGFLQYRDLLQ